MAIHQTVDRRLVDVKCLCINHRSVTIEKQKKILIFIQVDLYIKYEFKIDFKNTKEHRYLYGNVLLVLQLV